MGLIFWWMPLAFAVLIAVVFGVLVVRRRRRPAPAKPQDSLAVAHSDRLTALPAYRSAMRRYRVLLASLLVVAIIAVVASVGLASRPSRQTLAQPELKNRDIVLCLDISGSMVDYDTRIVGVFAELSKKFTGERISLVLFNASAVTYFPLSSDYDYVGSQLKRLQTALANEDDSLLNGTLLGNGSSLIGDGLASCATRFDTPESDRSRSIILATDNLLAGKSIFTLPEAGQLASEKGIRVYGINPGDTKARDYLSALSTEYKNVVESTGGGYFPLDDPSAIPSIVDRITAEQAAAIPSPPQLIDQDIPQLPLALLILGVAGVFVLAWRLRT